jgi:CcmD family protein
MGWLFAAYTIVWAGFVIYAFSLHKKQKAISQEIADLKRQLGPGK